MIISHIIVDYKIQINYLVVNDVPLSLESMVADIFGTVPPVF